MATSNVTASMRAVGWNVHFTIGSIDADQGPFAGVYQVAGSDLVTFRDVVDELRLCFEGPGDDGDKDKDKDDRDKDTDNDMDKDKDDDCHVGGVRDDGWRGIAFMLKPSVDQVNEPSTNLDTTSSSSPSTTPSFITTADLDQPVPSLPPRSPKEQQPLQYLIIRHTRCTVPADSSLDAHLKARCARYISCPSRRREPRYIPPPKPSSILRLYVPRAHAHKARSTSSSEQSVSCILTPQEDDHDADGNDDNEDDCDEMNVLASMNMEEAKRVAGEFHASCLNRATCCAVTREGQPWCPGQPIGPGVEACHIVPQQHYLVYPTHHHNSADPAIPGDTGVEGNPRQLQEAWTKTWSHPNGILLTKHLHQLFDARLFSIHPRTLRIRAFVPYDVLVKYNGQKACIPSSVDRRALGHHYDMCCIENMAAECPNLELARLPRIDPLPNERRVAGTSFRRSLSSRPGLPLSPSSHIVAKTGSVDQEQGRKKPDKKLQLTTPMEEVVRLLAGAITMLVVMKVLEQFP